MIKFVEMALTVLGLNSDQNIVEHILWHYLRIRTVPKNSTLHSTGISGRGLFYFNGHLVEPLTVGLGFGVAKFDKKQPLVIYGDDVRDASVLAEGHGYLKKYLKFEKVQVIIASKNDSHCQKFVYLMFHCNTRTQIGLAVG